MKKILAIIGILALSGTFAEAVPVAIPLPTAVQGAEIIVVGTLSLSEELADDTQARPAVGTISVSQVLKGPKTLKSVKLRTTVGDVIGEVQYRNGASGIWLLHKGADDVYEGRNPACLQPFDRLEEIESEIRSPTSRKNPCPAGCLRNLPSRAKQ